MRDLESGGRALSQILAADRNDGANLTFVSLSAVNETSSRECFRRTLNSSRVLFRRSRCLFVFSRHVRDCLHGQLSDT